MNTNNQSMQASSLKQTFIFEGTLQVRVVVINGIPYFVAVDVAKALGYYAPKYLISAHCRSIAKCRLPDNQGVPRYYNVIPEYEVYRLIFRSNLPTAEKFQDWVYNEVLPVIRKTDNYGVLPQSSVTEQEYRNLEMMYSMEKHLRELFQKESHYYMDLCNKRTDQMIERNGFLMKMIAEMA